MGSQKQSMKFLAIDDVSLPLRKNVCLYLSKPQVRPEPVLAPSPRETNAPDNGGAYFYGTVLHEQGKFRMWYYACHLGKNPDWPPRMLQQIAKSPPYLQRECQLFQGPLCYAESTDGIHWEKPALNQVRFKGNSANNAFALPQTIVSSSTLLRDDDEPNPQRRYKMVYEFFPDQSEPKIEEFGNSPTVALAISPDGLHWTMTGIPFRNQFVEHCSFIKHAGAYIIHYQVMADWVYQSEGGAPCGRTGIARQTYDFERWPDLWSEAFALPEPRDPKARGMSQPYDQVHLGVGAASFGNVCVGLFGLWHNAHFDKAFHEISGDLGLLVSNDGLHFREPVKGHVFIHRNESPTTPVPGRNFNTVLCQGNGLLNVGDTTYIYHGRWRNVGNRPEDETYHNGEIALATLPRDRWGALGLNSNAAEGVICSAPFKVLTNGALAINADGNEGITAELLNERFQPIPGFSAAPAGPGGLDCQLRWPGNSLTKLEGQAVRLQLRLRRRGDVNPRLYAVYLT